MKVEDKRRILESMGEVESYEFKDMNNSSFVIASLTPEYQPGGWGSGDEFSQGDGRTESSALHKLYKVTQRKLLTECYRIASVKRSSNGEHK